MSASVAGEARMPTTVLPPPSAQNPRGLQHRSARFRKHAFLDHPHLTRGCVAPRIGRRGGSGSIPTRSGCGGTRGRGGTEGRGATRGRGGTRPSKLELGRAPFLPRVLLRLAALQRNRLLDRSRRMVGDRVVRNSSPGSDHVRPTAPASCRLKPRCAARGENRRLRA